MDSLNDYYHDERMQKMFQLVEQPKSLEDIDISESFIKNLVLKIISTYGNIIVNQIYEITGLHVSILEEVLQKLEKDGMCSQTGGGFLFPSVEYTIKKAGHEKALQLMMENPYIGISPVSYNEYFTIMGAQVKGRFPLKIPEKVIQYALKDVVGVEQAKKTLIASSIGGTGFFIYGPPGTDKTFLTSKMSDMLPPNLIPNILSLVGVLSDYLTQISIRNVQSSLEILVGLRFRLFLFSLVLNLHLRSLKHYSIPTREFMKHHR